MVGTSCSPPPNIQTPVRAHPILHVVRHPHVLHSMVSSDPAGAAVYRDDLQEEIQHGGCSVVVMSPKTDDEPCLPIDETVDDELPTDQP